MREQLVISPRLKKRSPIVIAAIIGLLIGIGCVFCVLNANESVFCLLLISAPLYLFYFLGQLDGAGFYLFMIAYYLVISTLPVYLSGYFLPKYLKNKYCVIGAVLITATIHITLSILGVKIMGDSVRGIGEAIGTAIRNGSLDNVFR